MSNEDPKRFKFKTLNTDDENDDTCTDSEITDLLLMSEEDESLTVPFLLQDIAFVFTNAGGSVKNANKRQLSKISPVFEAMFSSNFKESSAKEVPLPGKKISTFMRFLRLALPGYPDELKVKTAREVLPLVREYQVEHLKHSIDSFLSEKIREKQSPFPSTQLIANIIEAEEYNLNKYLEASIKIAISKKYSRFISEPRYDQISKETQDKIAIRRLILAEKLYDTNIWSEWQTVTTLGIKSRHLDVGTNNWREAYKKDEKCTELMCALKRKFDDAFMQ